MNLGPFGQLDWDDWLLGLCSAVIIGGANGVVAGAATMLANPTANLSLVSTMATTFVVSGAFSFFLFLRNGLPKKKVVLTERTVRSQGESPVVTTIREETHVEPMQPDDRTK